MGPWVHVKRRAATENPRLSAKVVLERDPGLRKSGETLSVDSLNTVAHH